jgi:hypothetical protein
MNIEGRLRVVNGSSGVRKYQLVQPRNNLAARRFTNSALADAKNANAQSLRWERSRTWPNPHAPGVTMVTTATNQRGGGA